MSRTPTSWPVGDQVCSLLDDGESVPAVIAEITEDLDLDAFEAGSVTAVAVIYLCPTHLQEVQDYGGGAATT